MSPACVEHGQLDESLGAGRAEGLANSARQYGTTVQTPQSLAAFGGGGQGCAAITSTTA